MSAKVNLTLRVPLNGKDRFCPVVLAANGRLKPEHALVDGAEQRVPGGRYYIDWTEGGKRRRKGVGANSGQAVARQLRKQTELKAVSQGISLAGHVEDKRRRLVEEASSYLGDVALSKKRKTFQAYTVALAYFQVSCRKTYVEEIDRRDMLVFAGYLRDDLGLGPRTVRNNFANVMIFLKYLGLGKVVGKNDWPRFVESEVEVYEKEDLDRFFASCKPDERLWFEFFLMTGMREQEVIFAMGRDLNPRHNTVSMTWKPEFKWLPKAYKEREVPVPSRLMDSLVGLKRGRSDLLFPTSGGKPKFDFLDRCKMVSKRAGLDPADWYLHKFRATFATWHLRSGVDLRTVQQWLGHVDLASTLRYLRPARGAGVQEKVNLTFS